MLIHQARPYGPSGRSQCLMTQLHTLIRRLPSCNGDAPWRLCNCLKPFLVFFGFVYIFLSLLLIGRGEFGRSDN